MADAAAPMIHIDFEVMAVFSSALLVRFRVNDKHLDMQVNWNGEGDVIEFIKNFAFGAARQMFQPPPPSFDKLQEQVGKQGHVDMPPGA